MTTKKNLNLILCPLPKTISNSYITAWMKVVFILHWTVFECQFKWFLGFLIFSEVKKSGKLSEIKLIMYRQSLIILLNNLYMYLQYVRTWPTDFSRACKISRRWSEDRRMSLQELAIKMGSRRCKLMFSGILAITAPCKE